MCGIIRDSTQCQWQQAKAQQMSRCQTNIKLTQIQSRLAGFHFNYNRNYNYNWKNLSRWLSVCAPSTHPCVPSDSLSVGHPCLQKWNKQTKSPWYCAPRMPHMCGRWSPLNHRQSPRLACTAVGYNRPPPPKGTVGWNRCYTRVMQRRTMSPDAITPQTLFSLTSK